MARLVLAAILFAWMDLVCGHDASHWDWGIAFLIYMVAVLSDGIDGYLARSRNLTTAFGRIADPLADKIIISGVLVMALSIEKIAWMVPAWLVVLVLAREFLVSGLRGYIEAHGGSFGAKWEGKLKLVVQAVYCAAILFYPATEAGWVRKIAEIGVWATAGISIYSAGIYLFKAKQVITTAGDV